MAGSLRRGGTVDHAVGTSKTFRQLARIAGAAPSSEGFYVKRFLQAQRRQPVGEAARGDGQGRARQAARGVRRPGGADDRPARSSRTR